jgi:hypothetical protein
MTMQRPATLADHPKELPRIVGAGSRTRATPPGTAA